MAQSNIGYKYRFSSGEREKIEGILAWKWGIQSHLPVGHSYRNVQPTSNTCPKAVSSVVAVEMPPNPVTSVSATYAPIVSDLSVSTYNGTKDLEMIWVEPGTFTMGSPTTEAGRNNTEGWETEHEVTLTQGFYLGKYEVTQAQYEAVMTGNTDSLSATPSQFGGKPDHPVDRVTWNATQVFLERLNEQQADNLPNGWAYALPTEAEWEYACRAGTNTRYSWGDTITLENANWGFSSVANYNDGSTTAVGSYAANPWGFYDMHGNLYEWTADAYANYATGAQTDPFNVGTAGSYRIRRGGAWSSTSTHLRSAYRSGTDPNYVNSNNGFRLALRAFKPEPPVEVEVEVLTIPTKIADLSVSIAEKFSDLSVSTYGGTKDLEMIWVEPGTFIMGSPETEAGRRDNETQHEVTLTQGFYLGKYEVTQAQYEAVMTGNTDGLNATPSQFSGNPDRPVEYVSWNDVQVFLERLNEQAADSIPAGWTYVLPTEEQWEYACRAGTTTAYSFGDTITTSDANYDWNGDPYTGADANQTTDVGSYPANPWGFYDMHGNVFEWTSTQRSDDSRAYYRGGSWRATGIYLRSAIRYYEYTNYRYPHGFRVALVQT